ncbi:hypothetical protein K0M31_015799 [Melipona bicolor]|uniref:Uncharacterized protein n=1 Tax=Melipona bicolor TaxID=60889 RepID=A0AA40KEY6_9HYME|nr:hypothetical protein K0M31_015799 [Melipona bicolor]
MGKISTKNLVLVLDELKGLLKLIHRLRPGDIDVIAAMGDSLTVSQLPQLMCWSTQQLLVENREISASIGGQETWRFLIFLKFVHSL